MRIKSLFVFVILLAALALSACGPAAVVPAAAERVLSVTGTGQAFIKPDIAYIYVGVHTENPTAADAVSENNAQTAKVIDALKKWGVDAKDIHTSNFRRDLTKIGSLLDTLVQAGANTINSIQFDLADKTAAMKEARAVAMKNAQEQAQELAGLANVSLMEITNISYADSTPYVYAEFGRGGGGGSPVQANVPIEPGQMTITATVSVTYGIK